MAEQMVMMELVTNERGKDCKGMLREKLKKRTEIVLPIFIADALIFSLCIVVSVLHEKKMSSLVDCVLRLTLESVVNKKCSFADQYPLSNEVYAINRETRESP